MTCEEVEQIHARLIDRYGGAFGILDRGKLESSLAQPKVRVFGYERHAGIPDKAAAYCYFIARNHPFVDGNKRTAFVTALYFLRLNGLVSDFDDEEILRAVEGAAAGTVKLPTLKRLFRRSTR